MKLIYLSPHLDDAVYSCGGKVWQDIQRGDSAEIWTIFAGDPTSELTPFARELHTRWGVGVEAVDRRRGEDRAACSVLGATYRHLDHPDCIYRLYPETGEPVIRENDDLFRPVQPGELALVRQICDELLERNIEGLPLFSPLGIGGHLDHRIVRAAAEATGLPLVYYADFPYAAERFVEVANDVPDGCDPETYTLNENAREKWMEGVAAYASQLSSFWPSIDAMHASIREYSQLLLGHTVWKCVAYRGI